MISKKDLMDRIFDLECVVDLLEGRIAECERTIDKKKKAKKNGK